MHTWDRAPLKFMSCLNFTIQIFTWREKHVLQRYVVSQISYGGSIDNMEQTINCFTEVVFNVAVWYLSSRKMMSRYPLPDLPQTKHIWFLTRSSRSRCSCDNHRGSRRSRGRHDEWTCASTRWSSHSDLRSKMYPTYSKMATNFVFLCLHDNWPKMTLFDVKFCLNTALRGNKYHGTQLYYPPDRDLSSG